MMKKLSFVGGVVLSVITIGSGMAQTPAPLTPAQLEANKRVAMEFYRPGITVEERIALIHKDYIQHNATYVKYAKDHNVSAHEAFSQIRRQQAIDQAAGRAAVPGAAATGAPQGNTFHILYAEGDLVVRIAQRWNAVPGVPGRFYETFFWDTFQVKDGHLYQHWDAAVIAPPAGARAAVPASAAPAQVPQPSQASLFGVPALTTAPPAQAWPPPAVVPAAGCSATPAQVAANKQVATAFFKTGITPEERLALLDVSYVQHNPVFKKNAFDNKVSDYEAFKALMAGFARGGAAGRGAPAGPQPPAGEPLVRVVGACDVVTIIHSVYDQDPTLPAGNFYEHFNYDTFRVRNGKLVEHWDGAALPPVAAAARGVN